MATLTDSQKTYLASQKTPDDLAAFYRANGLGIIDAPAGGTTPSALGTPIGNEFTSGTAMGNVVQNIEAIPKPTYTSVEIPEIMDWNTALEKAKMRINPQYDSLRTKYETSFADQRAQIPQLLAARYGMSGTRGGRRQSSEYGVTQRENASISELESQRIKAQQDMAEAIQNQDWGRASQIYSMQKAQADSEYAAAAEQYRMAMEKALHDQDTTNEWQRLYLKNQREDARNSILDSRYADETAYDREWQQKEWDYELQQDALANALKSSGGSGGGGSRSSGSGEEGDLPGYRYTADNLVNMQNKLFNGEVSKMQVQNELVNRANAGQISWDEYNQWVWNLFPEDRPAAKPRNLADIPAVYKALP